VAVWRPLTTYTCTKYLSPIFRGEELCSTPFKDLAIIQAAKLTNITATNISFGYLTDLLLQNMRISASFCLLDGPSQPIIMFMQLINN
jgi:hypothetical protein